MSVSVVNNWPMCNVLDPASLASIAKICVFDSPDIAKCIYITKNDEVFSVQAGGADGSSKPRKIELFSKKEIRNIAFGSAHVLVVTGGGTLFSWDQKDPVQVTTNFETKRIVQVVCGSHHSLALSDDGEIYSWDQNDFGQLGSGAGKTQPTPIKINFPIGTRSARSIACGPKFSIALLDNGEVYGWGYNGNGQLGSGTVANQPTPCKIATLSGVIITQIVCGQLHTLALSDEGSLYSWGDNSQGQLGTGDKTNHVSPCKINSEERFIEIAAIHCSNISAALTQTGKVFMWGQCRGRSFPTPVLTRFLTTDDVFATFSSPTVTWRMYHIDNLPGTNVIGDISKSFDDSTTSDITFITGGKEIHCHKAILKTRCDHFRSMFQSHWDEDKKESIKVPHPYPVYRAFLYFLYTDTVNLCLEEALGLMELADSYCEHTLKRKCEQIIKNDITVENAAMLYAAAIKYDAKELEEFSFKFTLNLSTAVTQTLAFSKLDEDVLRKFIVKAATAGVFKY